LPQTLTDPDKILQTYVGRAQISGVKVVVPWPKGCKMAVKRVEGFFNGYNELAFLCNGTNGTDRHEFRTKIRQ